MNSIQINMRKKNVRNCFIGAVVLAFLLILPWIGGRYFVHVCIMILTYIIATSGLRTIFISGQASIGHAAFMGIGAYCSAILAMRAGLTPWLTIPFGAGAAMLIATFSGYLFSRLRAMYFAMVTAFFGVAVEALIRTWVGLTGGRAGLTGLPGLGAFNLPFIGEINFATSKIPYYYVLLVLALFTLVVLYRIERSRTGMNWMAIAQSPLVASSIGISETRFRILAFAVGCFFAGLAGGVYAHYSSVLSSSSFSLMPSINLFMFMLFGGTRYFAGPVVGVIVMMAIPEIFRPLKEYAPFIYGGVMLVVVFFMPAGLAGLYDSVRERWSERF